MIHILLWISACYGFNEDLEAKHYSMVDAGVDEKIGAGECTLQFLYLTSIHLRYTNVYTMRGPL